jgi:hypothetical protein
VSITWSIVSNPGPDSTYNLGDQIRIVGGPFPTGSNTNTQYIQVFVGGVSRQVAYNGASFDGSVTTFTFIYNVDATDNSSSGISIPSGAVYGQTFTQQTFSGFAVSGATATSYTIAPAQIATSEGSTVTFTVSTTGVSVGQQIRYSLSGVSSSDVSVPITGSLTVDSTGSASLPLGFLNDNSSAGSEGTETATLTVGEVLQDSRYSTYILERGTSATISVTDTSYTSFQVPPQNLSFSVSGLSFNLISPVITSTGKVFYWLDFNRDGTSNGDTLIHDNLDSIFNAGADTTVQLQQRSFSHNGYTVVLPTYSEILDLIQDKNSQQPSGWGGYYLLADAYGNGHRDAVFNYSTMTGSAANSSTQESAPGGAIVQVITLSSQVSTNPTPICFARGTQIKTAQGPAIVESLNPHETVIDNEGKATNVKWIGYQRRTPEFAQFDDYLPVKICAGALEENVPVRDLYLSPDHAILIDGHLIHAKALVNGKSIVQMTEWQGDIEYYHIETENHEIIFAEGVPCETFIDNVSRQQFDNYAEYAALYPFSTVMKELPLPRVRHRRQLPSAIATRIDQRAQVLARQASS